MHRFEHNRRAAAIVAAFLASTAGAQTTASVPLSGTDADGYFAIVGFNQEGNQTLQGIERGPSDAKFFDYPAYINPDIPTNIFVVSVEPYRFGLEYPDPLAPLPAVTGDFASVGPIRPASEAGDPGVTFIEGVSEDADFELFDVGMINFDTSFVTGAGEETVGPDDIMLVLDGTEFQSTNRVEIIPGAAVPPFGPEGRSNRNEFANVVTLTSLGATGTGLTFQGGLLTSVDLVVDVELSSLGAAFPNPLFAFVVQGTLTISGSDLSFDVDGQASTPFSSNSRLLLTRSGAVDAVGEFVVPGACPGDYDGSGGAPDFFDVLAYLDVFDSGGGDYTGDGVLDFFDVLAFLTVFDAGCNG